VSDGSTAHQSSLLAVQARILDSIARDSDLDTTLAEICRAAEEIVPGSKAGVTLLDRSGRTFERCVMPSAPTFAAAIAGIAVGPPHAGTCAAAVWHGQPFTSTDIALDDRFDPAWRRLNRDHDIQRIQARPAMASDGRTLGSFFIGFEDETRAVWPEEFSAVATGLAGLAIERHLARERERLIAREAQHRVKNLFASVLSLAAQTAHNQSSVEEFMRSFEGRVRALAAGNDLLSADQPVDLGELVQRIVEPFASAASVEIEGGPFKVAEQAIVPFSLVLHELATNAAKYGALSRPGGVARIAWKAEQDDAGEQRFKFEWEEKGGPPVSPPTRRGFGTLLVTRAFADVEGRSELAHAPDGVRYRVDAPITSRLGWFERPSTRDVEQADDLAAL
jgi:two-component sensor histidine kinase